MLPDDADISWHDELSRFRDIADQRVLAWAAFKSACKTGGAQGFNEEDAKLFMQFGYRREAIAEGNRAMRSLRLASETYMARRMWILNDMRREIETQIKE